MKWRKKDIEKLPVVDIAKLSAKEIEKTKSLLEELAEMDFPCLIDQLETGYKGRIKLDKYFSNILDMDISEEKIILLQREIGMRLRKMQKMMMRD